MRTQFLVIKEPKIGKRTYCKIFMRVISAESKRVALEFAQQAQPELYNDDDSNYKCCRAEAVTTALRLVL